MENRMVDSPAEVGCGLLDSSPKLEGNTFPGVAATEDEKGVSQFPTQEAS